MTCKIIVCVVYLVCAALPVFGEEKRLVYQLDDDDEIDAERRRFNVHALHVPNVCERTAKMGDELTIHYTGTYEMTGEVFDSTLERQNPAPFTFIYGEGEPLRIWKKGIKGMCIGEKRRLVIPPSLTKKEKLIESIPQDVVLEYDIELLDIKSGMTPRKLFNNMDISKDGHIDKKEIRAWILNEAVLSIKDSEEVKRLQADPSLLDPMAYKVLREDDADGNGKVEFREVEKKWLTKYNNFHRSDL